MQASGSPPPPRPRRRPFDPSGWELPFFLTVTALAGPWLPVWFVYPGFALLVVWFALLGRQLTRSPMAASVG
jgi:hypothetical protein